MRGDSGGMARWPSRLIADSIRGLITAGELTPGDKLPSERELARRFGTARNTAREGIRLLADEGLVTAQHGRGVFVRKAQQLYRWGNDRYSRRGFRETRLTSFRLEMERQGKAPRVEIHAINRVVPPIDVAERLLVQPDEPSVLERRNTYYADDDAVQVVTTYIRWFDAEGTALLEADSGPGGVYGRLEELGHVLTSGQDEISARMAHPGEAAVLSMPSGVPVLDVLHTSFDQNGEPFEVTRFVLRADLAALAYRFPIEA